MPAAVEEEEGVTNTRQSQHSMVGLVAKRVGGKKQREEDGYWGDVNIISTY